MTKEKNQNMYNARRCYSNIEYRRAIRSAHFMPNVPVIIIGP